MARKTVRLEDLPPEARQEIERKMDVEAAEQRFRRLLTNNKRLLAAARECDAKGIEPTTVFGKVLHETSLTESGPAVQ